jgi:hypothetical protein
MACFVNGHDSHRLKHVLALLMNATCGAFLIPAHMIMSQWFVDHRAAQKITRWASSYFLRYIWPELPQVEWTSESHVLFHISYKDRTIWRSKDEPAPNGA